MPRTKQYTAHKDLKLDCGHSVKKGAVFQVVSVFTCGQEATWPVKILMACFQVMQEKQSAQKASPQTP